MTRAHPPIVGGARLPAGQLARAHGAAGALADRGVGLGSRVAVAAGTAALDWLLGADLLGAATLVLEPSWPARTRDAVLADARPDLVVTGPAPVTAAEVAPAGDGRTRFYLATTSGSSGPPKVLVRSRDSWLRSFAALGPVPGPVLVAGPLASSLFAFGALHALWCGAELWVRPRLRAADARLAATLHVVPAMLDALLAELAREEAPVAVRTVVCGGAHVGDRLRARFARVLPGAELVEYYGSAEHSLIAIRRGGGELRPVPGVRVEARDGVLWVRSPLTVDGRLRAGALEAVAPGWSTVGDRGELTASGALVVRGRGSATINSAGRLVAAEEVEALLRGVPGVDDVLVCGRPHARLGAVVTAVIEASEPPALRELRAAARAGLAPEERPRRWLVTRALPRLPSGKPARQAVAEQLAAGVLAAEPLR